MHTQDPIVCENCKSTFKQVRYYLSHIFECKKENVIAPSLSHEVKTVRALYDERFVPGAKVEMKIKGKVKFVEEEDGGFLLVHILAADRTFKFL